MAARLLSYENIGLLTKQHIIMVLISSIAAILTAVPLGILISRERFARVGAIIENIVNVAQTVPSIAILALFFTILGLGFNTAVFALWLYSLLPILRNTYAGITGVSKGVVEAAQGMGMPPLRILTLIELPLASPVIIAGIRTAVVVNVGTATLATFVGAGGYGDLIVTGIAIQRLPLLLTGCILSALLAIICDHILAVVEKNRVVEYQEVKY
ncbi:MetI-like domain [Syntrophomonas zehnderi OL-4]|uniref:MetI-like domain n=1 Tax=Syntrophomonas zehnderi OL-4 TaxID=690567 RepID=A0A0E4C8E9_9FIRM|nr:ABC transporter permease [Syntrophomonas zehnderi]CFX40482.1 MetI-like domain [Syntrophomonas zehnderi OL-4]